MLHFYNTLTRRVEPFQPLQQGRVSLYTCGPTVYNYAHIGNFRTFLFEDLLRRVIRLRGWPSLFTTRGMMPKPRCLGRCGRNGSWTWGNNVPFKRSPLKIEH